MLGGNLRYRRAAPSVVFGYSRQVYSFRSGACVLCGRSQTRWATKRQDAFAWVLLRPGLVLITSDTEAHPRHTRIRDTVRF